jgi:hypothetical protein
MPLYSLQFEDDDLGQPKRMEFTTDSPATALSLLQTEGVRRSVKLWEGDRLLGTLMRDRKGVWHPGKEPLHLS